MSSPCWMQNYLHCEDVLIENITVENQVNFNNDGLDIDGCKGVIVRNCTINSEDDAMCFKGASERPAQDILIENCKFYSTCNCVKFGTDSRARSAAFSCAISSSADPRPRCPPSTGATPNPAFPGRSSTAARSRTSSRPTSTSRAPIRRFSSASAIAGACGPEERRPGPGTLRRIVYDKITGAGNGSRGSYFMGIPEKRIEDIVLRDVKIEMSATDKPIPEEATIPEMPGDYPDAHMIPGPVPAFGLWTRHLTGLTLIRTSFSTATPDPRPMLKTTLDTSHVCVS